MALWPVQPSYPPPGIWEIQMWDDGLRAQQWITAGDCRTGKLLRFGSRADAVGLKERSATLHATCKPAHSCTQR